MIKDGWDVDQWRVEIHPALKPDGVSLTRFTGRSGVEYFDSTDELPVWLQEKLALLAVMSNKHTYVAGQGERMLDNVYWVDVPE